eukprot:326645-Rhodomonas_salina.2
MPSRKSVISRWTWGVRDGTLLVGIPSPAVPGQDSYPGTFRLRGCAPRAVGFLTVNSQTPTVRLYEICSKDEKVTFIVDFLASCERYEHGHKLRRGSRGVYASSSMTAGPKQKNVSWTV